MKIEMTQAQCASVLDFIETNMLDAIRKDVDIDNVEWVQNLMDVRREIQRAIRGDEDAE